MTLVKKNVRRFESQEEYEAYYENHELFDYVTNIVEDGQIVSADAEYKCSSWKTAVRRFFKAIAEERTLTVGWDEEWIIESIENGYWSDESTLWNNETCRSEYTGDYAWCVEETIEGYWYISLKVRKGIYGE